MGPMDPSQAQILQAKLTSRPKPAPSPTHAPGLFHPASPRPSRTSPSDSHSRKSPPVTPAKRVCLWTSLIPYMTHNIKARDNMCSHLLFLLFIFGGTSLVAQMIKRLPTMQETRVPSLGQEDPLENEMATHSSTLAWKIPWTEKCGRLQSTGSGRVRHD